MTTTIEFITAFFCQVDDHLAGLPTHPEAHLWPSEVVTLGLLHALKGVGNRMLVETVLSMLTLVCRPGSWDGPLASMSPPQISSDPQ